MCGECNSPGHALGPGAGAELLFHLVTETRLFVANSGSRVSPDSDKVPWFQSPACPPILGLQSSKLDRVALQYSLWIRTLQHLPFHGVSPKAQKVHSRVNRARTQIVILTQLRADF